MHLLAHALCGATDDQLLVGQIAGDYVRGRDLSAYPDGIARGIRQHRLLDSFTDRHPVAKASRARLAGSWRRYAGVLVDLAYGHSLAVNWPDYADMPLDQFDGRIHALLMQYADLLPPDLQRTRKRLRRHRIFIGIGDQDGLASACARLAHRLPALAGGETVIAQNAEGLASDFALLWPELRAYMDSLE